MKEKVLISGGTGLVGKRLSEILLKKGYAVAHLSHSGKKVFDQVESIPWNPYQEELDFSLVENCAYIIHLSGAGIVDKPWTEARKKVLINSRVKTGKLLAKAIQASKRKPKAVVSASAIGYYGIETSDHIYKESDHPGNDFLAQTCIQWEDSMEEIHSTEIPLSKVRIGLVLSSQGGALKELVKPIKFGLGAALGSGKQWMPWIHIDDLCELFIYCLENKLEGVYNGVAPNQVSNTTFTKTTAKVLNRPVFLPNVPAFFMKMILGSRAQLVLEGSRISVEKLKDIGFTHSYTDLENALKDLLH